MNMNKYLYLQVLMLRKADPMKKFMIFAVVCVLFAACTKISDTAVSENGDTTSFEKDQKVTFTVSSPTSTKVTGNLDGTTGEVSFKWETGDKIKVTVGTESSQFTLKTGAGTAEATFEGTMPAAGDQFDVQYPVTDPDLSSQTYIANGLPNDKMKFSATGCTLGNKFTLAPQYAALRLNLYGLSRDVSSIVVTNTTAEPNVSYTLNCNTAVRVGNAATTATPFLLVVPTGSWKIKVDVTASVATSNPDTVPEYSDLGYTEKGIVLSAGTFSSVSAQAFAAGNVMNMPARPITIVWAPVNCGYEAANGQYKGYPYGRMYQWGRKYGQGYKDSSYEDDDYIGKENGSQTMVTINSETDLLSEHPDKDTYNGIYYCNNTVSPYNWYAGPSSPVYTKAAPHPEKLWNTNEGTNDPVSKSAFDPCPNGWRVPTKSELEMLLGTKTTLGQYEGTHGTSTMYGSRFDGADGTSTDNYVFLPLAGCLDKSGNPVKRGNLVPSSSIYYWSSSVDNNSSGMSYALAKGGKGSFGVGLSERVLGHPVRCVRE